MRNALLEGLGGPVGRYARPAGLWFNPVPWSLVVATVTFLILTLRQVPCIQTSETEGVNAFIRLCYSDIPLAWTSQGLATGALPFGGERMLYPPVLGLLLLGVVMLARQLGAPVDPGLSVQAQLDGAQLFFSLSAVMLFVSFLAWVLCMALLGRDSKQSRRHTWEGMWVAASPVILASGLISWDLLPIALTAFAMVHLSRGHLTEAGIVLGLAAGAGTMAIAVILAVAFAFGLRGTRRHLAAFSLGAALTFATVNLPLVIYNWKIVTDFYFAEVTKDVQYGSLFFLGEVFGVRIRSAGVLGLLLTLLVLAMIASWIYLRGLRPRVGTLVALFVFPTVLFGPAYPPQTGLWLLFALLLACPWPRVRLAFVVTQIAYWLAVWAYLAGHLTPGRSGNPNVYFLALFLRVVVEAGIVVGCLRDVAHPSRDPLRAPDNPDPIGGVLNDTERAEPLKNPPPLGLAAAGGSVPDQLIAGGGGQADGDRNLVAHLDSRIGAADEQHRGVHVGRLGEGPLPAADAER